MSAIATEETYETAPFTDEIMKQTHPGFTLQEDILEQRGITRYRLAKSIGITATAVAEILDGRRAISAEVGLLLDRYTGTHDGFWYSLQADYDIRLARRKLADRLDKVVPLPQARTESE